MLHAAIPQQTARIYPNVTRAGSRVLMSSVRSCDTSAPRALSRLYSSPCTVLLDTAYDQPILALESLISPETKLFNQLVNSDRCYWSGCLLRSIWHISPPHQTPHTGNPLYMCRLVQAYRLKFISRPMFTPLDKTLKFGTRVLWTPANPLPIIFFFATCFRSCISGDIRVRGNQNKNSLANGLAGIRRRLVQFSGSISKPRRGH